MTEKYELRLCNDGNYYVYHKGVLINAPYISFDKFNKEDAESIIGELNHLSNENEQLKKEGADVERLIDDLGSEELRRQYEEIINGDNDD